MRKFLYIALFCVSFSSSSKISDLYLPNGIKLILKEDDTVSSIGISVLYNVGSHDDPVGKKGMVGLQRFLMEYSGSYGSMGYEDRNARLEEITEESVSKHTYDLMYFSYSCSPRWLNEVLDIEAQRLANISISEESLLRTRQIMFEEGFEYYSEPQRRHNGYPENHPYKYNIFGDTTHVKSISVDDAVGFRHRYINPNSTTIVIVGNFNSKEVVRSIYSKFGGIVNNGRVQLDPDLSVELQAIDHRKFKDDSGVNRNIVERGMFIHGVVAEILIPSFREDDTHIIKHITNLIRYDSALEQQYAKKYLNRNGAITMTFTDERLGTSSLEFVTINLAKKKSYKKIVKNLSSMIRDIAENGFDQEAIDIYRKRELLKLYTKRSSRLESVNLGWSELIAGDYMKYDRELEILEALDNDEIKRVAKKYLAGKHINSNEFLVGDRNLLTPIFSFIWNGVLMRSSSMRVSMKKSNLGANDD